jgi:hypothetical protein
MLVTKVRIVNRRGFMMASPRNKGIVRRSAVISGSPRLSKPKVRPEKRVRSSDRKEETRHPMTDVVREAEIRVILEGKVKRRE